MANGSIEAYTLPAWNTPIGHHTYVVTQRGNYACHGRWSGGQLLRSGQGNIDQADCLATVNGGAGINYMRTGVCHQAANRILYPAGMTVVGAKGFPATLFAYGVYGIDPATRKNHSPTTFPWPELAACNTNHSHP